MTRLVAVVIIVCIAISNVSSRSMTMMASKYLGKSPVFVAGGSNGVGLEIVKQLTQLGTPVHALVRREVLSRRAAQSLIVLLANNIPQFRSLD